MRATWTLLAAFLAAVIFAAGCGGGGEDLGYEDEEEEETGSGGASVAPGMPGMGTGMTGTPTDEDPTRGGYAPRVTVGSGQGGVLSQAEFEKMRELGEKEKQVVSIHQQYFQKKEDGNIDVSLLESGISLCDQILDALKGMRDANPASKELEMMEMRVGERRRDLVMER
jgi:hypothetical protein